MDLLKSWEFKLIFKFFSWIASITAVYLFAVTFLPIRTPQMKYSDYAIPFLLGSVISGIMGALIGIIAGKRMNANGGNGNNTDTPNPTSTTPPAPSNLKDQLPQDGNSLS